MNVQEIYQLGLEQGWDEEDAYYLATIAMAESKGKANQITPEPNGTESYGIWQINSVHLPALIEAGILHLPQGGESVEEFDEINKTKWDALIAQLFDPAINAEAAEFVGHHRDYPNVAAHLDDWDFNVWSTHTLEKNHPNNPSRFDFVPEPVAMETPAETEEFIAQPGGPWRDPNTTYVDVIQQEMDLGITDEFGNVVGVNSDLPNLIDEFGAENPNLSVLPENFYGEWSWLDLWGDSNPLVEDFLNEWADKFNEEDEKAQLDQNFVKLLDDFEKDLYNQFWWNTKEEGVRNHLKFYYESGGLGPRDFQVTGQGIGNPYNAAMADFRKIAENVLRGAGLGEYIDDGIIDQNDLNRYASAIMSEVGATQYLAGDRPPLSMEAFQSKATQVVENQMFAEWIGDDGKLKRPERGGFGPGSVRELMNTWRARAKDQFLEIDENELRKWAMEVKTETGLTEDMVLQTINERAFDRYDWPITTDQRKDYLARGVTMKTLLNPQWMAVRNMWEDDSIEADDPWLLQNYVVNENGFNRFRNSSEMADLARNNLGKMQHTSKLQGFLNDFITNTAGTFRSDYI